MNDKRFIFLTKSAGVMDKMGDSRYSNERFIDFIRQDTCSSGKFMSAFYSAPLEIRLPTNEIPGSWSKWEIHELKIPDIEDTLENDDFKISVPEIPGEERLFIPRGALFKRKREIIPKANMKVVARGIKGDLIPKDINACFCSIINGVYFLVEDYTTASLSNSSRTSMSSDRMSKFIKLCEILDDDSVLFINIALLNSYVEPSTTMVKRFYYLSFIYGMEECDRLLRKVYKDRFAEQINSIKYVLRNSK